MVEALAPHLVGGGAQRPLLEDARAGAAQELAVDVGADDGDVPAGDLVREVAAEQDREGVGLSSGGTPGAPDPETALRPDTRRAFCTTFLLRSPMLCEAITGGGLTTWI